LLSRVLGLGMLAIGLGACASSPPSQRSGAGGWVQEGIASYYGHEFHGRQTASGEIYDETKLTAAHRTLSFGTRVRVTNLENGRNVTALINDRGPFVEGRVIDLSYRAAQELDFVRDGLVRVRVEQLLSE
jgi:rare lipoprotein A